MFGLIDAMIREFLGKYGKKVLDALLSNSFIVCSIVVLYGAILIFAQRNLEKIGKKAKTLVNDGAFSSGDPARVLEDTSPDFWEQLSKTSQFPLISAPSSFLLYRITQENMKNLLPKYYLIEQRQWKPFKKNNKAK